jgi:tetratricopeptide (TPR) repeat protein
LSAAGQWDEATAADEEAVGIWRRIAAANPAVAFRPSTVRQGLRDQLNQADILANLAVDYGRLGRPLDAVTAMESAARILRLVRRADPDNADPSLARVLDQLSNQLSAAGRPEDGLAASREAVAICRRLAAANPGAHEYRLAGALSNLSIQMDDLDQIEDAIAAAGEAVGIYRRLVKASPGALSGDLAQATGQHGNLLWKVGRLEEARSALEEAAAGHRKLAAAEPGAHEISLALTLSNMTNVLFYLGSPADALARNAEAVEILRRHADSIVYEGLAAADPRYQPTLARAQYHLGHGLTVLHRAGDAQGPLRAAVALFGQWQDSDLLDRHLLARSLTMFGLALAANGQTAEGLERTIEGVEFYRLLAQADWSRYSPDLAEALDVLGRRYDQVGREEEAAGARNEATSIRQQAKTAGG